MSDPFEHPLIAEVYDAIPSHQTRPDIAFYTRLATESPVAYWNSAVERAVFS